MKIVAPKSLAAHRRIAAVITAMLLMCRGGWASAPRRTLSPPLPRVTIAAVGDLMFNGLSPGRGLYPLRDVARLFHSCSLTIANLETPLTDCCTGTSRKTAADVKAHKQWVLRGSPGFARAVAGSGIKLVGLANNHDLDYGPQGVMDTCVSLDKAGVAHAGSGQSEAHARQPAIIQLGNLRVALLAYLAFRGDRALWTCTPAGPQSAGVAIIPDNSDGVSREGYAVLRSDIRRARERADLVFVYFHWGLEREPAPTAYQVALAHAAVRAGANMVLGAHPHVLQGFELYHGAPVIYSLGNFVAGSCAGPLGETTVMVTTWRGARCTDVTFHPARIICGSPRLLRGSDAAAALQRFRQQCAALPRMP